MSEQANENTGAAEQATSQPVDPAASKPVEAPVVEPYSADEFDKVVAGDPRLVRTLQNFENQFTQLQQANMVVERTLMALVLMANPGDSKAKKPLIVVQHAIDQLDRDDRLRVRKDPGGRGIRVELMGPNREIKG